MDVEKDGAYVRGTSVGALNSVKGDQSFIVPALVNVDGLNEIYIWWDQFAVPLGVALLK
ncbi:DM13 domain-containing protein [Sulfitobacter guttiformis]|uniref:DM13 domain-containing protein n=1 Tax=Sulfitobacter guttiformis TaxID=74349 RepID=UPI000AE19CCF|nr:DM13 domain-containing protein [Sulfitobacter guttiformis]KIN74300.1 putative twin-arginine translocation pathway signal sequence domain protein [Sulfitobacter guttiformis KCTC 32187]